jgi:hypothetical protein
LPDGSVAERDAAFHFVLISARSGQLGAHIRSALDADALI